MLKRLRLFLRDTLFRSGFESSMKDEIRFHIESRVEDLMQSGHSRSEAERRARLEFGSAEAHKEDCRQARGLQFLDDLRRDVQLAFRQMRRNLGYTAVAVLILAIGIGANTAIFTLVNALILRPLPYPEPHELMLLNETSQTMNEMSVAYPNFLDWREQNDVFDRISAMREQNYNLTGVDQPMRILASQVSAGLFEMLGARPVIGRVFEPSDDRAGSPPVAILTYALWSSLFGGDRDVLSTTIQLDGEPYTVIGVMPPGFVASSQQVNLFLPIGLNEIRWQTRGNHPGITGMARLKDGVTIETARSDMEAISRRLEETYPDSNTGNGVRIRPLEDVAFGPMRAPSFLLLAAVGSVLLIACFNIANLLLARATTRGPELAVRTAIGASRGRVVRQLLTESLVLAVLGGALGILTGFVFLRGLLAVLPAQVTSVTDVNVDLNVLVFTACVCFLTGILFGLAPAFAGSRVDLSTDLKEGGRSGSGGRGYLRRSLIISEVAVAAVLLVAASLLMRSFYNVIRADPGFEIQDRLLLSFSMPEKYYPEDHQQIQFIKSLLERITALPGVESAGVATPLLGNSQTTIYAEGSPIPEPGEMHLTDIGRVSPNYLDAMGIRLLKGRYFTEHDTADSARVVVVDKLFADRYWEGEDPVGKRVKFGNPTDDSPWFEIVGTVAHVKNYGVDQYSRMELYMPYFRQPVRQTTLVVHAASDPAALAPAVTQQVREIDAQIPVYNVRTMEDYTGQSVAPAFLVTTLLGAFAAAALLLAAIGLYGLMSYTVVQRHHEIGVRIALGARSGHVLGSIISQGARLTAAGLAIGLALSYPVTGLLESMLFGVAARDVVSFVAMAALLAAVAVIASYFPARRAVAIDPTVALRHE